MQQLQEEEEEKAQPAMKKLCLIVLPDPETMSKQGREGGGMFFLSFTLDSLLCLSEKLVFGGGGDGCSCCKVSPQQLQTPAGEDNS
jgi:hypothetical protein